MRNYYSSKNLTFLYILNHFFFWSICCCTLSNFSVYLLDHGFNNTVIGFDLAAANLMSCVLLAILGPVIDRSKKYGPRFVSIVLDVIIFVIGILMSIFDAHASMFSAILFGIGVMLVQVNRSYLNALAVASLNESYTVNFGISRASGSLGYAIVSVLIGILLKNHSTRIIPLAIILTSFFYLIVLILYPDVRTQSGHKDEVHLSTSEFFKKYSNFGFLLIGLTAIYFGYVMLCNFTLQFIQSKGGDSSSMGISNAIQAILEMTILVNFDKISKKFRISTLIAFSSVFFPVKIFFVLIAKDVTGFYLAQLFQIPSWAIMTIAVVLYVDNIIEKGDAVKGQSYAIISYTLASILSSLIGGRVIDLYGSNVMLFIGLLVAAVGAMIINISIVREKRK